MGPRTFPEVTTAPDADAILAALDPEQREVARHPLGPMGVIAGAGTGKTRAITHRIAYGVRSGAYSGPHVLALTFTARAAGEMRTRLRELGVAGVQARTFHAAALRQLHYFYPAVVGGAAPEVMPAKAAAVAEAAGRLRMRFERTELRDLASEIEWAKVMLLTPDTYAAAAARAGRTPPGLDLTAMARVMGAYEDVKGDRGVIDFEDVLLLTLAMVRDRPEVGEAIRGQYRHFVVDEYQDVNTVQQRLLEAWLGGREDLCVVGDPAQTIYSFTGASAVHLTEFPRRYPAAPVVRLHRNYLSTSPIVSLANSISSAPGGARRWGGVQLEAQAPTPTARGPDPARFPMTQPRRRGSPPSSQKPLRPGPPRAVSPSSFAPTGRARHLRRPLPTARSYLIRGGERFFARRESAKRSSSCEHARTQARTYCPISCGPSSRVPGGRGPRRRRAGQCANAGSLSRRSRSSPTSWPPSIRRRPCAISSAS